jgi:hypothetical protein
MGGPASFNLPVSSCDLRITETLSFFVSEVSVAGHSVLILSLSLHGFSSDVS